MNGLRRFGTAKHWKGIVRVQTHKISELEGRVFELELERAELEIRLEGMREAILVRSYPLERRVQQRSEGATP